MEVERLAGFAAVAFEAQRELAALRLVENNSGALRSGFQGNVLQVFRVEIMAAGDVPAALTSSVIPILLWPMVPVKLTLLTVSAGCACEHAAADEDKNEDDDASALSPLLLFRFNQHLRWEA